MRFRGPVGPRGHLRKLPRCVPTISHSGSPRGLLATFPSANYFPCHTSENSPVSPAIATDPKTPLSNPCICHTCETPRGLLLLASSSVGQKIRMGLPPFSLCPFPAKEYGQMTLLLFTLPASLTPPAGLALRPERYAA